MVWLELPDGIFQGDQGIIRADGGRLAAAPMLPRLIKHNAESFVGLLLATVSCRREPLESGGQSLERGPRSRPPPLLAH